MKTGPDKATKDKTAIQAKRFAWFWLLLAAGLAIAPPAWAGQHGGMAQHPAPVPHATPRPQGTPRPPANPKPRLPQRPPASVQRGQQPVRPFSGGQQGYPPGYPPGSPGTPAARPVYPPSPYSVRQAPSDAGHLPQWMAQHQSLPLAQQEKMLRAEPGFNRLNPTDQQREIQQLHQLNELPEAQRQRRLARAEALERLSPNERMQVNQAGRQMAGLPPDRQAQVRRAFQDLRNVPVDQRETVLNSARYGAAFSAQERGILQNLLRVEPYEAPH